MENQRLVGLEFTIMNKYIVSLTGVTSRTMTGFERKLEVYEQDDLSFAKKLLSILEFRNRNTHRIATGDYHSEHVYGIIKITLGEKDGFETYDEVCIENANEFETLSKYYKEKLSYFWDDGGSFSGNDINEITDEEYISRQDRIYVIEENLKIH